MLRVLKYFIFVLSVLFFFLLSVLTFAKSLDDAKIKVIKTNRGETLYLITVDQYHLTNHSPYWAGYGKPPIQLPLEIGLLIKKDGTLYTSNSEKVPVFANNTEIDIGKIDGAPLRLEEDWEKMDFKTRLEFQHQTDNPEKKTESFQIFIGSGEDEGKIRQTIFHISHGDWTIDKDRLSTYSEISSSNVEIKKFVGYYNGDRQVKLNLFMVPMNSGEKIIIAFFSLLDKKGREVFTTILSGSAFSYTKKLRLSSNEISFEIENIFQNSGEIIVTPSNKISYYNVLDNGLYVENSPVYFVKDSEFLMSKFEDNCRSIFL